jgi:hypothetical protein
MRAPGGAEGVAEGDGAAVDVGLLAVEAELLLDREVLRGEGLVDLDEVHLVERELGARGGQRLDRRDGADAHDLRLDAGDAPLHDAGEGGEAAARAKSALASTRAAAPSLMPDALPAVTTPSFLKTGLSFARASGWSAGAGARRRRER